MIYELDQKPLIGRIEKTNVGFDIYNFAGLNM